MSTRMTVVDLAKELKIEPNVLVERAKAKGTIIRSRMIPLDESQVAAVRAIFAPKPKQAAFMTPLRPVTPKLPPSPVILTPPPPPVAEIAPAPVVSATPTAPTPVAPITSAPAAPTTATTSTAAVPPGLRPIMSGPVVSVLPSGHSVSAIHTAPQGGHAAVKAKLAARKPTKEPQKPKAPVVDPHKPKVAIQSTPAEVFGADKTHAIDLSGATSEESTDLRILRPTEIDQLARTAPTSGPQAMHGKRRIDFKGGRGESPYDRFRGRRPRPGGAPAKAAIPVERKLLVQLPISVKQLSHQLGIRAPLLIARLMDQNIMSTINTQLDEEACIAIGLAFDKEIVIEHAKTAESVFLAGVTVAEGKTEDLALRAPVVTVMGHVDHGKTSLLDWVRKSQVAAGEAGGITQHIRAYRIDVHGKPVVFLDTPGHEAFTSMRARGANVTDIVLLVVAADDGMMPQTEEAIAHARAADVKIVVALNKIDKPQADTDKVMRQLSQHNLVPEKWGGNTVFAEVSAVTGQGMQELLELLALEAEMLELKGNPKLPGQGAVLEARMEEGKGIVATVLILNGTLRRGDIVLCGSAYGRVRALFDDGGRQIQEAGPATPVGILGLSGLPEAGSPLHVIKDLALAKEIAEARVDKTRAKVAADRQQITLENIFNHIEKGKIRDVRIILKADVKGSVEVLRERLHNLSTDEVAVNVIHYGVGPINESDVILAEASKAIVLGFTVDPEESARSIAKDKGVDIRRYDVIYHLEEDMKAALEGLLEPERVEIITGHLRVKEVFKSSKFGAIAGCVVTDGKVERSAQVRVVRAGQVLHDGKVESLRRFKDDVREVLEGFECGMKATGFDDPRAGDIFEAYTVQHVARKLTARPKAIAPV